MSLSTLRAPAGCLRTASIVVLTGGAYALLVASALGASPGVVPRGPEAVQRPAPTPPNDPAARGPVSRARILECGHQWNNMKRAGTAAGTWKDFSRICLAQR